MPRPSLKEQRREAIFDACERCFARYGVAGTSLENVGDEAGLARALIRHNVGNREALIQQTAARFAERSVAQVSTMAKMLPPEDTLPTLVDWLFDPEDIDLHMVKVGEALTVAAGNDPELSQLVTDWVMRIRAIFEAVLRNSRPKAAAQDIEAVAAGLIGIYFNVESLSVLGEMPGLAAASQRAAHMLVERL